MAATAEKLPTTPEAAPLLWMPKHGGWVLFRNGYPWVHRTAESLCVGIFQKDSPIIDPATGKPETRNGLPVFQPRHIVPVDKNGSGYMADRTNFKDAKGAVLLLPFQGLLSVDNPRHLEILEKHFADNRLSELQCVVRLEDCGLVGPLRKMADMPPGRVVDPKWNPEA